MTAQEDLLLLLIERTMHMCPSGRIWFSPGQYADFQLLRDENRIDWQKMGLDVDGPAKYFVRIILEDDCFLMQRNSPKEILKFFKSHLAYKVKSVRFKDIDIYVADFQKSKPQRICFVAGIDMDSIDMLLFIDDLIDIQTGRLKAELLELRYRFLDLMCKEIECQIERK